MSRDPRNITGFANLPPGERIDMLCDAFESEWKAGRPPQIEEFLGEFAGGQRSSLLRELVALDLDYARREGRQPSPDDYLSRFPDCGETLRALFDETLPVERQPDDSHNAAEGEYATVASADRSGDDSDRSTTEMSEVFGDYELVEEIARGGMGVVYKALQKGTNRIVALKMILAGQLAGSEEIERFYTEAEAAANLDHPNIVPVYEVGQANGRHYFSMGFVEGSSLADVVREQPLPTQSAVELTQTIARAIEYAHRRQIIHRDLKPANILLDREGTPRVTDFGLAKRCQADSGLTATGQIMGTPSYMPPEQAAGKTDEIGPPADVYSLGAVLYHLLTGRPPFRAASLWETIRQVIDGEPVAPRELNAAIDRDVETIVLKALQKEPSRRYATAAELADDLGRYLEHRPIVARPISTLGRLARWSRRNKSIAALLTVLATVVTAVVIGSLVAAGHFRQLAHVTRQNLYLAEMNLASEAALSPTGVRRVRELVNNWQPDGNGVDLRGWEWYYLYAASHQEPMVIDTGSLVQAVAWSPDDRWLAWANWNHVSVLDLDSHQVAATFTRHEQLVRGLAFNSDSTLLATASSDKTVAIWNVATATLVQTIEQSDPISGVCFSPDDRLVAFQTVDSDGEQNAIHVWERSTDREVAVLEGVNGHIVSFQFSPDGRRFAAAGYLPVIDHTVRVWNAETWQLVHELHGHTRPIYAVAFSPDGKQLASAGFDRTIKIWDAIEGRELHTLDDHLQQVTSVAFSPHGKWLASASWDHTVRLWNPRSGRLKHVLGGHTHRVHATCWSPGGDYLASASDDETVRVWDAASPTAEMTLDQGFRGDGSGDNPRAAQIQWGPGGHQIATALGHPFTLWDADTGEPLFGAERNYTQLGEQPCLSHDGQYIASQYRDTITVWDRDGRQAVGTKAASGRTLRSFSPVDGRLLLTATPHDQPHAVWSWDVASDEQPREIVSDLPAIESVCWSPNGRRMAVGLLDHCVRICDSETGAQIHEFAAHEDGRVTALAWRADGSRLATASNDQSIKIWNTTTWNVVRELRGHTFAVWSVDFSPDGKRLASGSADHTVKVWDPGAGMTTLTYEHDDEVGCVAWSPDGRRLASMSQDGVIKIRDASRGYQAERDRIRSEANGKDGTEHD